MKKCSLFSILVLACAFVCAQTQPPESVAYPALSGTVHDPSDAAIVGARVILLESGGNQVAKTTTDNTGRFHFDGVTAGRYKLEITREGFRTTKTSVSVGKRRQAAVQVILPIATVTQEVTVGEEPSAPVVSADVAENQSTNTIDRAALDRVPVFDQDYLGTLTRFLDDSSLGTNGVTLIVNGVEANGPGVTASAVQEVKINQNPYSALFSRPGRARLEIITKDGTPKFHGTVNVFFRDSVFDARNPFATMKPREQKRYYEGSLTGPVGRGAKTTFLLSLDRQEQDEQAVVVAQGVAGPINLNAPNPRRSAFASGRIFHDIGETDQFWIGYSYESREKPQRRWRRAPRGGHEYQLAGARNQCELPSRFFSQAPEPTAFFDRPL